MKRTAAGVVLAVSALTCSNITAAHAAATPEPPVRTQVFNTPRVLGADCGFSTYWTWGQVWVQYRNCGRKNVNVKFVWSNGLTDHHCVWAGHTDDIAPVNALNGWSEDGGC